MSANQSLKKLSLEKNTKLACASATPAIPEVSKKISLDSLKKIDMSVLVDAEKFTEAEVVTEMQRIEKSLEKKGKFTADAIAKHGAQMHTFIVRAQGMRRFVEKEIRVTAAFKLIKEKRKLQFDEFKQELAAKKQRLNDELAEDEVLLEEMKSSTSPELELARLASRMENGGGPFSTDALAQSLPKENDTEPA